MQRISVSSVQLLSRVRLFVSSLKDFRGKTKTVEGLKLHNFKTDYNTIVTKIIGIALKICLQANRIESVEWVSSVAQSCPTLCDPMNRSTPGLPVHHQLPEFTQTRVHGVSDAIQPSHPLSSSSPPAPNPSQHQSLFQ